MQSQAKQNKGLVLTLPSGITISNNSSLVKRLQKVIQSGYERIILDFSQVSTLDLSSIQIILSFVNEAFKKNISLMVAGPLTKDAETYLLNSGFMIKNQLNESILFPFLKDKGVKIGHR